MSTQDQTDYQTYIAKKHAQMLTPSEMRAKFVKKATGQEIVNQERLMSGEANEVYDVTLANGVQVIFRISHEEYQGFGKEKWAIEQCQIIGVPVPKVLLVEDDKTDGKFRSFCVLEKLNGESLMQRMGDNSITAVEKAEALREVGKILSRIHTVKTEKFGWLMENGIGMRNTWTEYVMKQFQQKSKLKNIAAKIDLDPDCIDQVENILLQHQDIYSQVKPRLLHGDLAFGHIFIDGINITGIIDWGNAVSGDQVHDFAWWNSFNDDESTAQLVEGYKSELNSANKKLFESDFELRLNLCKLYLNLDFLDYYDEGNFKTGLEIAKNNLLKSLKYFN